MPTIWLAELVIDSNRNHKGEILFEEGGGRAEKLEILKFELRILNKGLNPRVFQMRLTVQQR